MGHIRRHAKRDPGSGDTRICSGSRIALRASGNVELRTMVTLEKPVTVEATTRTSVANRYYVLVLLTLIYGLNFLDRTIFNVLIEPIKREFQLSDTAMGLLAGFGFVLFYSALGMPVA